VSDSSRMQSAGIRAVDAYASVRRRAARLCDELDDVTDHGNRIPATDLDIGDSAVIAVDEVRREIAASSDRVQDVVALVKAG
jgi:hypothetical protein